jgi:hypothetical protein
MLLIATSLGALGCEPELLIAPEGSLLRDPSQDFPERFSEVGLYPAAPDFDAVPSAAHAYEPAWPLWSNGSAKRRHIVLPSGETIDNTRTLWRFPAGTLLFKTFLYPDPALATDLRPIETRVMRLNAAGEWDYAAYRWREDATEADLVDPAMPTPVPVRSTGDDLLHTIPAALECRTCHESRDGEVLGFEPLQLGGLRESGGTQLDQLAERGLFAVPPAPAEPIEHEDPTTQAVLGYFYGDCVHCHNGGDGPSSSFDLRPAVALDNTIGVMTASSASAFGVRIVPGDPAASILFQSTSGETPDAEVKLMPPLGVDVRNPETVELLRGWISGLGDGGS